MSSVGAAEEGVPPSEPSTEPMPEPQGSPMATGHVETDTDAAPSADEARSDLVSFLMSVPLLTALSPADIGQLAEAVELVRFGNRSAIITQGDIGMSFFILMQGKAEVIVDGTDKRRVYQPKVRCTPL
jgi:hypothetical protein